MRKWFIYFLIAVLILCFMSCKGTERIVEVQTVKTEYKDKIVEKRDSIYVKDSTFVYVGGDTVYMYKYKNIYRDKIKTDTLYITKRDSVAVPYPVEKKMSYWEENLLCRCIHSACSGDSHRLFRLAPNTEQDMVIYMCV